MTTTLGDICQAIVDCEHKTAPEGDGFALSVGTRAMKDGRIVVEACKPVSEQTYNVWTRRMPPRPGDLILAREAPVGQVVRVPNDRRLCLGQRTVLIRPDPAEVHPRFLHYWLLGPDAQDMMAGQAAGATVPHLNVEDIRNLDVGRLPRNRGLQAFAAAGLGALDDLIENTRRRIDLLEQMAQAIYREWFVRFRYTGHEDDPLVDSPVGPIPEGWSVKSLGSLSTNFDRLRRPLSRMSRDRRSGSFPYYGAAKLIDWIDDWIFDGEYLLFAEDGTVQTPHGFPVLQLVHRKFWANNHTHILQGRGVSTRFLFLASAGHPIAGYVTGAAQPKITQANLNRIPLIVGPPAVHGAFDKTIDPIFDTWNIVQASIAPLQAIRDLLLPKLVTGQIDVSDLDLDALVESVA